jgi:hypothetical protein
MFLDNTYTKRYYKIINHALTNPYTGYTEAHHIVPKSLGGTDEKTNIINLSARAHFVCHRLLTKMVVGQAKYKMLEAVAFFSNNSNRNLNLSSRNIAIIREANAIASSIRNKGNEFWKFRQPDSNELKALKSSNAKKSRWVNDGTVERFTQEFDYYISHGYQFGRLPFSKEWTQKIASNHSTGPRPQEVKDKISKANAGVPKTEEAKKKMSIAKLNAPKYSCEYCGGMFSPTNLLRWHGAMCKLSPSYKSHVSSLPSS